MLRHNIFLGSCIYCALTILVKHVRLGHSFGKVGKVEDAISLYSLLLYFCIYNFPFFPMMRKISGYIIYILIQLSSLRPPWRASALCASARSSVLEGIPAVLTHLPRRLQHTTAALQVVFLCRTLFLFHSGRIFRSWPINKPHSVLTYRNAAHRHKLLQIGIETNCNSLDNSWLFWRQIMLL